MTYVSASSSRHVCPIRLNCSVALVLVRMAAELWHPVAELSQFFFQLALSVISITHCPVCPHGKLPTGFSAA